MHDDRSSQERNVNQRRLTLELLPATFSVVRLAPHAEIPTWASVGQLVSITRTAEELSIVCDETLVPSPIPAERGLRCVRVVGPLELGEIGVLASLATPLARSGIGILAVSTYDTDYLFVAESKLAAAVSALREAGHAIRRLDAF